MTEAQVSHALCLACHYVVSLLDDILQNRYHVISWTEYPAIATQVLCLPACCQLLVGDDALHDALVSDAGQRGVQVDQVAADVVCSARQSLCAGEYAWYNHFA